jgi:PA14 domain
MKPGRTVKIIALLLFTVPWHDLATAKEKHWETPFGTTLPEEGALHGRIYSLRDYTPRLPDFETLHSVGDIYAYSLQVKNQNTYPWHGLPNSEWYAIDYRGEFWLPKRTRLKFFLYSDDGSKLYIDDQCAIDNDGIHSIRGKAVSVRIPEGLHRIRISYFQGPAPYVALVLMVRSPGQEEKPFDTRDFALPADATGPAVQQRQP